MTELNLSELLICSVLFGRMGLFDTGGSGTFACVVLWFREDCCSTNLCWGKVVMRIPPVSCIQNVSS